MGHLIKSDLSDDDDVVKGRNYFIEQLNTNLFYSKKLHSNVHYKLFQSYCSSYYGCELWHLANSSVDNFCAAWRKGLRRIWKLPNSTLCTPLPVVGHCFPIFDECVAALSILLALVLHMTVLLFASSPFMELFMLAFYGIVHARNC
jgi:hypothetical protein